MEKELIKIFNKITATISILCTTLTSIFGIEWILFAGYLLLNLIDYFTGIIKAKVNKNENSHKGLIGIIKKVGYWCLIALSFLISYLLVNIGHKININIEFIELFGWFTLACLVINEARSILENLIEIGIDIPNFLKVGLETYQEIIEHTLNKFNSK